MLAFIILFLVFFNIFVLRTLIFLLLYSLGFIGVCNINHSRKRNVHFVIMTDQPTNKLNCRDTLLLKIAYQNLTHFSSHKFAHGLDQARFSIFEEKQEALIFLFWFSVKEIYDENKSYYVRKSKALLISNNELGALTYLNFRPQNFPIYNFQYFYQITRYKDSRMYCLCLDIRLELHITTHWLRL